MLDHNRGWWDEHESELEILLNRGEFLKLKPCRHDFQWVPVLTIHGERYCVLGEFWKEADGDQLLLHPGEETIWYYAHEQDKVKCLCNDMTELLEKKLARYFNEH